MSNDAIKCPVCGAENPKPKICVQCGAPLPAEGEGEPMDRFKALVAFLIAVASIFGAFLAYRTALAAGNAADADVSGIVSSVNMHQAQVASEADLYRDIKAYLQVRIHDRIGHDLVAERDQYPSDDPARDRLWDEAWTETRVAEAYLDEITLRPEYIRPDGSYDEQAALSIAIAHRALASDFDREGHFAEADRLRSKMQWSMAIAVVMTLTLLSYTLAEVINRAIKYLFLALGSITFATAIVAMLLIELAAM